MAYKGPSSNSTREGVIRLAGDLGGTFSTPTLQGIQGKLFDNTGNAFTAPGDKYIMIFNGTSGKWECRRASSDEWLPPFQISAFTITNANTLNLQGSGLAFNYEIGQDFTSPSSLISFSAAYQNGPPDTASLRDSINNITASVAVNGTFVQLNDITGSNTQNVAFTFTHNAVKASATATPKVITMTSGIRVYWGVTFAGNPTIDESFVLALNGPSSGTIRPTFPSFQMVITPPGTGMYFYYASPEVISSSALNTLTTAFNIVGGGYTSQALSMASSPVGSVSMTNAYGITQTYNVYRSNGSLFSNTTSATITRLSGF